MKYFKIMLDCFMVFNATFNSISVIWWRTENLSARCKTLCHKVGQWLAAGR